MATEALACALRDGVLGFLRAGEDVIVPCGRLAHAEDSGLVDLLAERFGKLAASWSRAG